MASSGSYMNEVAGKKCTSTILMHEIVGTFKLLFFVKEVSTMKHDTAAKSLEGQILISMVKL